MNNDLNKQMEDFLKMVRKETKILKKQIKQTKDKKAELGSLNEAENMLTKIKKFTKEIKSSERRAVNTKKKVDKLKEEMIDPGDIKPGKYAITFTTQLKITGVNWKKSNKFGQSQKFHVLREELITSNETVTKAINLSKLCRSLAEKVLTSKYNAWSDWEIVLIKDIQVAPIASINLSKIKMKGTKLAYKFIGDVSEITKKDQGTCVLDHLVYECFRHKNLHKWNRKTLTQFFGGEKAVRKGISSEQLIRWAKYVVYVNVIVLNPLYESFMVYSAKQETDKAYATIVLICNNNHGYPIVDPSFKKTIAMKGRIDLGEFKFDIKYEDHSYLDVSNEIDCFNQLQNTPGKIVLCELHDLCTLANKVITGSNYIITHADFYGATLRAFVHPVTEQIIISAEDYKPRKIVCEEFKKLFNCDTFTFKNQSWTKLAGDYFKSEFGDIPESGYGIDYTYILEHYSIAPYTAIISEKYKVDNLKCFDYRRNYTDILINNEVDYNVFHDFNQIEEFDGNLTEGEYYIKRVCYLGNNTIKISLGWWPFVLVKYLIEVGSITIEDIPYIIRPSYKLPAKTFSKFANKIYDLFKDIGAKPLNNYFIGELNKQSIKKTKGCVTDSYATAMGLLTHYLEQGKDIKLYQVGKLYFLRLNHREKLFSGHCPIWRHIIASSYIKLDKLHKAVVGPETKVIAYKVDSIKVLRPLDIELKDDNDQIPGDIHSETASKPQGYLINDLEIKPEYKFVKPEWKIVPEDLEFVKKNSCLVQGVGGCGKTEMNKNSSTENTLCLSETNKAIDVCRERGIIKSKTFDKYFGSYPDQIKRAINALGQYDKISVHIDEFSMTPNKFFRYLLKAKRKFPKLKYVLFGDINQCKPPETVWFDYMKSKLIMELVDYNLMTLSYKNTRYDAKTYEALDYFIKNKRLPDICKDKTLLDKSYTNICYYNTTRKTINTDRLKDYCIEFEKKVVKVNGMDIAEGVPVVAIDNDHTNQIYNSQMFTLDKVNDTIKLSRDRNKKKVEKEITHETFTKYFNLGFCCTVYKYQGDTIRNHYNIYDTDTMSFNELYTALSRCVTLDNVHFNYSNRIFYPDTPPKIIRTITVTKSTQYIDGKIYYLTDPDETWYYIGSTCQELPVRLKEHKQKPVNKLMVDLENCQIHLLESIPCSTEAELLAHEDRYIEQFKAEGKNLRNIKINIKKENKCS